MKVNYMISTAAVLAALLTVSCTKDLQENTPVSGKDSDKVTLLIAADEVTKTTFGDKGDKYEVKWEDTDTIGIFIASSSANVKASLKRIEGKAYFAAKVSNYNAEDQLCAYYPYAENAGKDVSKVTLKVPYIQTQTAPDKFDGSNNPMVAVPIKLPSLENTADVVIPEQLKFRHIGAVLEFDITGVPSNEKLKSVQFVSSDGGGFPATDNSIYDLTSVTEAGDLNTVAGTYYKSVTVSLKDGGFTPGQSAKVYMTIVPGTYNGNIYISTDKNLYRYEGQTIEANRAAVKPIKADLSSGSAEKSKEIKSALDYEAFAMAANAGDYSAWVDGGEVKLGADISTPTYFTRIQKVWTGKFNGQGNTIKQDASVVPLFTVIDEKASVSDLVLEGSKKSMADAGSWGSAAIAQVNYGTIENVENWIVVNINGVTTGAAISGIVKCNAGVVKGCTQKGNITVVGQTSSDLNALYAGGIACFASESDDYSKSTKAGSFINCVNNADIIVIKKSIKAISYSQHCVGGICAIVHSGNSVFDGCYNYGKVSNVDDSGSLSKNSASAVGGIIGRLGNYSTQYKTKLAFDIKEGGGFNADVKNCHNIGIVEHGVISTAPVISAVNQSGARTGCVGGIVGYANGLKNTPVEITGCSNTGTVKGGYSINCVMGGICGQTNYVNITDCTVKASFEDSETAEHQLSAVGGFVGVSLLGLTVKDSFVDISGTLTPTPVGIGVLQGFVKSGTPTYRNIQIRANLTYNKGTGKLEVTPENVETKSLYCTQALTTSGITYWNNNQLPSLF